MKILCYLHVGEIIDYRKPKWSLTWHYPPHERMMLYQDVYDISVQTYNVKEVIKRQHYRNLGTRPKPGLEPATPRTLNIRMMNFNLCGPVSTVASIMNYGTSHCASECNDVIHRNCVILRNKESNMSIRNGWLYICRCRDLSAFISKVKFWKSKDWMSVHQSNRIDKWN
jgi:hypothetical protein